MISPLLHALHRGFPNNVNIEKDILIKIEKAKVFLCKLGFRQCHVRYFGNKISIEVEKNRVSDTIEINEKIEVGFKEIGFDNIEIDPEGYKKGRMNLLLKN